MKRNNLLLVDDDGLVLATFAKGLKDHGYSVSLADSGEEAIRLVTQSFDRAENTSNDNHHIKPDLAILDMCMPGLTGIETATRLKQFDVPVIFLSAFDDEEFVKQAVSEGALAYLVKPVDVERAIPTIETALQRAREIKKLRDTETRLDGALETGYVVNVVVGILMERHKINRAEAFELLRKQSRSDHRKVKEVAEAMLNAWQLFNVK